MRFSVTYRPTALFSLRDSNSTSSGAKSLFLPSPYCVKMAFISQAVSFGGVDFENNPDLFSIIRDVNISYNIKGDCCVNNCFVKIQKRRDGEPFKPTVSFREYIYLDGDVDIIFDTDKSENVEFLKKYLHTINYFGKRGCFYQFIKYNDEPSEPNVKNFDSNSLSSGSIQEFDDFDSSLTFDKVNSYSQASTKRKKRLLVVPLSIENSSKSYTRYSLVK